MGQYHEWGYFALSELRKPGGRGVCPLSAIWNLSQHRSVKSEGATGAVTWESRFFPELFIVWRLTAKKRMVAKLKAVKAELQHRMYEPVTRVGEWLQRVAAGYYHYHAVCFYIACGGCGGGS
jgi:hypothetical protein